MSNLFFYFLIKVQIILTEFLIVKLYMSMNYKKSLQSSDRRL